MRTEIERALRRQTERELLNYRKNGVLLRAKSAGKTAVRHIRSEELAELTARELSRMRCWRRVIDRVLASVRQDDPLLWRFMRIYFALVDPRSGRRTALQRNMTLMEELSLSETLIFNMKRRAVECVLLAAVEAGLFRPYGLRGGRGE